MLCWQDIHPEFHLAAEETAGGTKMGLGYTVSAKMNSERVGRSGNGGACASAYPKGPNAASCIEIATGGTRWLTWPELDNKCCNCCSFAQGCGPMKADWVSANGKFLGQEMYNGVNADKPVKILQRTFLD